MAERQKLALVNLWGNCKALPPLWVGRANSVWFDGKLYIGGGIIIGEGKAQCQLIAYFPSEDSWKVIKTPTYNFSLAVYRSQLVLVGGCSDKPPNLPTNKVWLLQDGELVEHPTIPGISLGLCLDNKPIKVSESPAVGFGDNLFVALKDSLTVVVYNGEKWLASREAAVDQFQPLMLSTANGDNWFLSRGNKVCRFSLSSIVDNATDRFAHEKVEKETLPDLPCEVAGLVWFENRLLALGGAAIYGYNSATGKWDLVMDAPIAGCHDVCCGALPNGELRVCGGNRVSGAGANYYYINTSVEVYVWNA